MRPETLAGRFSEYHSSPQVANAGSAARPEPLARAFASVARAPPSLSRPTVNLGSGSACTGCPPPAAQGHQRPNALHYSKGPGALQKPVGRGKHAGSGEGQDEPAVTRFQRVENKHGRDGEQAEGSQAIHGFQYRWPLRNDQGGPPPPELRSEERR